MTTPLADYYSECNPQNAPDFGEAVCARCIQPECSRSLIGKSSFTKRVSNWEERLFTNPARLPETDPRYAEIASQKFVSIPVATGQWVSLNETAVEQPVEAAPSPSEAVSPSKGTQPSYNTPNKSKQMVGGATPPPVLDPWQPKQPLKPGEVLVQKGAKIRLS